MPLDLNHGSGLVYGREHEPAAGTTTERVNALVDAALVARNRRQRPRDYLGGSRVGEPCARRLAYEVAHAPKDPGGSSTAASCGCSTPATSSRRCPSAGCVRPASTCATAAPTASSSASPPRAAGCAATPTA